MLNRTQPWTGMRPILFVAAVVALLAALLPLGPAAGQAPAARSLLNVPFRGVATPGARFDLVQSVTDYAAGARSPAFTADTRHFLSVVAGDVSVEIDGTANAVSSGKGLEVPAGSAVSISNPGTQTARVFVSSLRAVGAVDDIDGLTAPGVTVLAVARRTMTGAPSVVDVVQMGAAYDVGYRTPDHIMNEFHLMLHLTGRTAYHYLDGAVEEYGPRTQATMYEGRPGWMGNAGSEPSSVIWTWVANPGRPLSTPLSTTTPPPGTVAPQPPRTGTGFMSQDAGRGYGLTYWAITALGVAAASGTVIVLRRRR